MLIIFFGETPIYLRIFIYLAQTFDIYVEIKTEICIIEKAEKPIATKL